MLKAFFKDSLIYSIPTFFSRGLSFLLIPLYTRVLSPEDYGTLDLLLVFASFVNVTVALEVSQGVARFYRSESSAESKVAYASSGLWFTVFCYGLFLAVSLYFSEKLATFVMGDVSKETAFRIGVIYIFFNGIYQLIANQARWELKSSKYALISFVMSLLTAMVSVYLAYFLVWGLHGLLIGLTLGSVGGLFTGLWLLRNSFKPRLDIQRLKQMLLFSSPLVLSGISVIVSTYIDRVMISHYLSISDVGIYGIAFRLASVIGLLITGFRMAFLPLVYKNFESPETPQEISSVFRIFIALYLVIFFLLSVFSREIIVLMTTKEFYEASHLVPILVPAIMLSQMYFFAPGIGIAKKSHYLIWINLVGALLNTFLNWFLIPYMGVIGAAIATLIGYICIFTMYVSMSQRLYYVPHSWYRIICFSILFSCFLAIILFSGIGGALKLLVSIVLVSSSLWMMLYFRLIDKKEIISLIKG